MAPTITPPPDRRSQSSWPNGEPDTVRQRETAPNRQEIVMATQIKTVQLYSDAFDASADHDLVAISAHLGGQLFKRTAAIPVEDCYIEMHLSVAEARELARELLSAAEDADNFDDT